jgi:uncharacterized protein
MISAVLDTNVIVSAQLQSEGPPARVSDLAFSGHIRCFVSEGLLQEYERVLLRPRFGFAARDIAELLRAFRQVAIEVSPRKRVAVAHDPTDNQVLECALEARADYVVTGNTRHFPVKFQDIRIATPRQFLTIFASRL